MLFEAPYDSDSEDERWPVHEDGNGGFSFHQPPLSSVADCLRYDRETQAAVQRGVDQQIRRLQLGSRSADGRRFLLEGILDEVLTSAPPEQEVYFADETRLLVAAIESSIEATVAKRFAEVKRQESETAERLRREADQRLQEQAQQDELQRKEQQEVAAREAADKERRTQQEALDKARKAEQERSERMQQIAPRDESRRLRAVLVEFETSTLAPVSENREWKNACARARLKINPKLGQLTQTIGQVERVFLDLCAVIDPLPEICRRWCLNFFCKALVKQAENEVMVNPAACYPLAVVAIAMTCKYEGLVDLLCARFSKKCPWTIGDVTEHDMGTESGRKLLGWRRKPDGKYEDATSYLERQTGIFRLYAAILSFDFPQSPWTPQCSWRWVAHHLNLKVSDADLRNVNFAIAATFLDIAGRSAVAAFGSAAEKLLVALGRWVANETGPNANRLRILLEECQLGKIGLDFSFER
ncbi:Nuclear pore complex nucleoporin component [Savitreella phatthalungensis]